MNATRIALATAVATLTACDSAPILERPMGVRHAIAAGGDLYVLNELHGRVHRLEPDGGRRSVAVGREPETLAATPDGGWVVTLSRSESMLWAVRTSDLEAFHVEVRPNHNVVAVSPSPSAQFAVTYVDFARLGTLDIDGSASLNEVTVVDLSGASPFATSVVVGFNPKQVVFTPDGTRAVVLSESFASILDLASPGDPIRIPLGANTTTEPVTPETVLITPDDRYALVARRASPDVFVIELDPPSVNIVDFGIVPDKFVASSDGSTVVGISRFESTVSLFDVESGAVDLVEADGNISDAVVPADPADDRVLFWSTGQWAEQMFSLDLSEREMTTLRLVNAPTRVSLGPGGGAVVLQEPSPTIGGDETATLFDQHDSLSLLDADERLITPHFLESMPVDVAYTRDLDGRNLAVISLRDAGRLAIVDLESLLIVSRPHVADVPRSLVPLGPAGTASPVAVIHDQPWGLVTFLHPNGHRDIASGFLLDDSL